MLLVLLTCGARQLTQIAAATKNGFARDTVLNEKGMS